MYRAVLLLALTLCAHAQEDNQISEEDSLECFDGETENVVDSDAYKLLKDAKDLAYQFYYLEEPMESKYELYKTACKNIEAKIVSVLKLPNFPLCKGVKIEEVDDTVNSTVKAHFAGVYFDFMCNMKEIEFLGAINWKKLIESFGDDLDECPQKIDKTDSSGMQYPDFCSDKVPEMLACFQKVLVGKDNAIAFHKALTNFYVGALCVGEVKEKTYQEEFKHLYRNDYSRFIEIMILP